MRLLHFLPSTFYGGPEKQILQTARELRARFGHASSFLVMAQRGHDLETNEFVQKLRAEAFPVRELRTGFHYDFIGGARKLRGELRANLPDLLLTYGYKADLMAALLPGGPRKVSVIHGWTAADRKVRAFEALDRLALRAFRKLVVISRSQVELLRSLGFPAAKIVSIPNALDLAGLPAPMAPAELKRRLEIPSGARVIGSVGRLSREKGHADLLRAFARLGAPAADVYVVLVGDGPEEAGLRALARELGVDSRVRFAGFQRDGGTWIGGMDLFVLPSFREALPLVLLEAFAYGTPVLGTRVGDVKFMVRDGETGWTVEPGNPPALAERLGAMLEAPAPGREMARNAHLLLVREFTPAKQADLWEALLTGL